MLDSTNMRKGLRIAMTGMLAVGMLMTTGCSSGSGDDGSADGDTEVVSTMDTWTKVKTLDAAIKGAGIKSMSLPDNIKIGGMSFDEPTTFCYTDGWVTVDYENGDTVVTIDKWNEKAGGASMLTMPPEGTQTSANDGTDGDEADSNATVEVMGDNLTGTDGDVTLSEAGFRFDSASFSSVTSGNGIMSSCLASEIPSYGENATETDMTDGTEGVTGEDAGDGEATLQWEVKAGPATCTCFGPSAGCATTVEWTNPSEKLYYRISCTGLDSSLISEDGESLLDDLMTEDEGEVTDDDGIESTDYSDIAYLSMTDEEVVTLVKAIK